MDSDSWNARLSTSSRRYMTRSDPFFGGNDETDADDEFKVEFLCPFCGEDFDVVGLCCHIDEEHPVEAKNGICPVCVKKVGLNLVGHLTMQHGNLLKVQRKRRFRRGGPNSTFAILRKELREGNLQSILGGSLMSASAESDPLLTSFIYNPSTADEAEISQPHVSVGANAANESLTKSLPQRNVGQSKPLDKDLEEKAQKCRFVQGLLLSTILDDGL